MTPGDDPSISPGALRHVAFLLVAVRHGPWCWTPCHGLLDLARRATFADMARGLWPRVSVGA